MGLGIVACRRSVYRGLMFWGVDMTTIKERLTKLETKVKIIMLVLFAHVGIEAIPVVQAYTPILVQNITKLL